MPIREEIRTIFVTPDGLEFLLKTEAEQHMQFLALRTILVGLDIHWRDTSLDQVAEELFKAGFHIVKRSPA